MRFAVGSRSHSVPLREFGSRCAVVGTGGSRLVVVVGSVGASAVLVGSVGAGCVVWDGDVVWAGSTRSFPPHAGSRKSDEAKNGDEQEAHAGRRAGHAVVAVHLRQAVARGSVGKDGRYRGCSKPGAKRPAHRPQASEFATAAQPPRSVRRAHLAQHLRTYPHWV